MTVQARVVLRRCDWDAAFFDMDGVLTDTARLHIDAWKRLFDEFLLRQAAASGGHLCPSTRALTISPMSMGVPARMACASSSPRAA